MAGETLFVYFLGTAGALPTPHRNPSCILVRRGSDTLLFDCGEGAQQQMMRARCGFTIDGIFITHWHADHFLGLFGLVQTLSFMGREDPLHLYGPTGVEEMARLAGSLGSCSLQFPIEGIRLNDGDRVRFNGYSVEAFSTRHGIESLGYLLREDQRPGRFDREAAISMGVLPGPLFGRLQRGETVTVEGREVKPADVMGAPRPGRTVMYTGDTRPIATRLAALVHAPDLLIHDATFDDAASARAREVGHSTAGAAGEAAALTDAQTLALVHLSSRYTDAGNHLHDAARTYQGEIIAPEDLSIREIRHRG
ncbi:MAG: ribonuclease Z [Methanomicrobiales archaeon]